MHVYRRTCAGTRKSLVLDSAAAESLSRGKTRSESDPVATPATSGKGCLSSQIPMFNIPYGLNDPQLPMSAHWALGKEQRAVDIRGMLKIALRDRMEWTAAGFPQE